MSKKSKTLYNYCMDGLQKISNKLSERKVKNKQYMHSPSHVLADELSVKLNDKSHFGMYLKMATIHDHQVLRNILGNVLDSRDVKSPGKLFTFLLKKYNESKKSN